MSEQSYSNELLVSARPELVFNAITKEIDKWWTTSSNKASKVGDELTVRFGERTYKVMKVTKAIHSESISWEVTEANIDHEGFSKTDEWVGTTINWKIEQSPNGSRVLFLHEGLVPTFECYKACQGGWNYFLESLKDFLDTGKGNPYDNND